MYILEVEENEAKVEKMREEGKDDYTIKKAVCFGRRIHL